MQKGQLFVAKIRNVPVSVKSAVLYFAYATLMHTHTPRSSREVFILANTSSSAGQCKEVLEIFFFLALLFC